MSEIDDLRDPLTMEPNPLADGSPRCSLNMQIGERGGLSLGGQSLKLQKFSGTESISQPFEFHLEFQGDDMATLLSEEGREWLIEKSPKRLDGTFRLDDLVGQECTVLLGMAETKQQEQDPYPGQRPVEFFNGILSSVSMKPDLMYEATLKPSIFRLSLQNHFRIFERKTALEVVAEVLDSNNVSWNKSSAETAIKGLARYRRQNWVQSGETDLDFLQRLIQKNGLIYYFVHSHHRHQMVITDQPQYEKSQSPTGSAQELYLFYTKTGQDTENHILDFKFEQNLVPDRVDMMLAEKEPSWLTEQNAGIRTDHYQVAQNPSRLNAAQHIMNEVHTVSYGASQREIDTKAHKTKLRLSTATKNFSGSSSCPRLRPGFWFVLKEAEGGDLIADNTGAERPSNRFINANYPPGFMPIRPDIDGLGFVAVNLSHSADIHGSYSNQFSAIEKNGFPGPYQHSAESAGTIIGKVVSNGEVVAGDRFLSRNEFSPNENYFEYFPDSENPSTPEYYPPSDSNEPVVDSQPGLLVELISPDLNNQGSVHWIRLAPHMTSIPEDGTFVLIGKSSDETEVPEIQQVIEQKGSKNVIRNDKYSVNASWGDSYSTSYGDSTRLNFPNVSRTRFEDAKDLVERKRESSNFADVSFSENNSFSASYTTKSHSVSVTSDLPDTDPSDYWSEEDEATEQAYVQYAKSLTFGNTKSYSEHAGDSHSYSKQSGTSYNESDNMVTVSHSKTQDAISDSVLATQVSTSNTGISSSVSSTGVSFSVSNVGVSNSASTVVNSNSISNVAFSNSLSNVGSSISLSNTLSSVSSSNVGSSISESFTGVSTQISNTGASTSISSTGISLGISNTTASISLSSCPNELKIDMTNGRPKLQSAAGVFEIILLDIKM